MHSSARQSPIILPRLISSTDQLLANNMVTGEVVVSHIFRFLFFPLMQTLLRILLPAALLACVVQAVRLVSFHVTQPPVVAEGAQQCTVKLVECQDRLPC